jgi:tRNA (guanine26-N2/guanine27-N2)-dimethyltransferase
LSISIQRYVIANDLSPTAAAAMRRNVAFNGVDAASCRPSNVENPNVSEKERERLEREWEGKVRVNEGDAW